MNKRQEHFELRYGSAGAGAWAEWLPVATVGPPTRGTFPVAWALDLADPAQREVVVAATKSLDYYLVKKGERDPWRYAQHHCGTAANIYSSIHWSFFAGAKTRKPRSTSLKSAALKRKGS